MAERRMFAKSIVLSDAFLDMPMSARCLYFTLGMLADDQGFIGSPKAIMRQCGASQDDMAILLQKRYILAFGNGVIVIKHWKMNNYLQNDRIKPTTYLEELATLKLDDKGAYTEIKRDENDTYTKCIQNVYTDKIRIDESSVDEDRVENLSNSKELDCRSETDKECCKKNNYDLIVEKWNELSKYGIVPIRHISNNNSKRTTILRARLKEYSLEEVLFAIDRIKQSDFLQGKHSGKPWQITFDWFILPSNFPKVLEGNYDNKGTFSNGNLPDGARRFLESE